MASKKVPTPPPGGPALVRPALGALLLTLAGPACDDNGDTTSSDTANDTQPPMATGAPMPAPTSEGDTIIPPMPPMIDPTTGDGGSSTVTTAPPPMPPPTGDGGSSTGGDSTSSTGVTTEPPPMPPPTTGE